MRLFCHTFCNCDEIFVPVSSASKEEATSEREDDTLNSNIKLDKVENCLERVTVEALYGEEY